MDKIYKYLYCFLIAVFLPYCLKGQCLFDDSNSSPLTIGNAASFADIDINATVYNPAGIVFFRNGLTVATSASVRIQSINGKSSYGINDNILNSDCDILSLKTNPSIQLLYKHNPKYCSWIDSWAINASVSNGGGMGRQTSDGCVAFDESFNANRSLEVLIAELRIKLYEQYARQFGEQYQVALPPVGEQNILFSKSSDYITFSDNTKWIVGGGFRLKALPSLSMYAGFCYNSVNLKGSVSPSFLFYNQESNTTYSLEEYEQGFVDFYDTLISLAPDNYQLLTYYNYHKDMKDYFSSDTIFNHYNDGGNWDFSYHNLIIGFDYLSNRFNVASKLEIGLQGYHRWSIGVKFSNSYSSEISIGFDCRSNPFNKVYSTVKYSSSKTTSHSIEWNISMSYKHKFNERFCVSTSASFGQNDFLIMCGVNNVPLVFGDGEVKYRNVNFTDFQKPVFKIGAYLSYNYTNNFSLLVGVNRKRIDSEVRNPNHTTMSSAVFTVKPETNISIGIVGHIF